MANQVRITSGKLRGRIIATPGGKTHPMGERERIALFNMIAARLPGAVVLDAYAGSGALGFEALSRGAKEVLFVDSSPLAESTIIDNMLKLGYFEYCGAEYCGADYRGVDYRGADYSRADCRGADCRGADGRGVADEVIRNGERHGHTSDGEADVIRQKVSQLKQERKFDIVLADPPYDNFVLEEVEHLAGFVKKDGVMVLSHPGDVPKIPGLVLQKTRHYAAAGLSLYIA